jgi:predicted histidine transporter YuiF (NhaC family)
MQKDKQLGWLRRNSAKVTAAMSAIVALGLAQRAMAVEDYDALVTAASTKLTGLSAPLTSVFLILIGLAIIVGVGYWLISMGRKKHG